MKDALESIPCEVYSVDDLKKARTCTSASGHVYVMTNDNVHTWARENGGPIVPTDEMIDAGVEAFYSLCPYGLADDGSWAAAHDMVLDVYAAMEAKRRELR